MFTGIVEALGTVKALRQERGVVRIDVDTALDLSDTKLGDSIACDGVCLTVTALRPGGATFDVGPETKRVSTLATLKTGQRLHLERAVRMSDRLGGHLVQGHVDCMGRVTSRSQDGDTLKLWLDLPPPALRLCIDKGSIAINGVSLTLNELSSTGISVWLIPHTLEGTLLGTLRVGDAVNIENDVIGKYVARLLGQGESGVTWDFLAKHGFGTPPS